MKIQKVHFYATIYAFLAFIFSMYISPFYTKGDQYYYIKFYEECFIPGEDQWFCFTNTTGSAEPVYFLLTKIAQEFISKDLYISIANAILVFLISLLVLRNYKVVWHRHLFLWLIFLNYYLIVLFFSAERLKFALIFILIAIIVSKTKAKIIFYLTALFTHVQTILLLTPYLTKIFIKSQLSLFKKILIFFATSLVGLGVFLSLRTHIESKFLAYTSTGEDSSNLMGVLKTLIFVVLASITTKKIDPLIAGLPLVIASFILGGERISVLAFFLYLGYVIYYKRKMDIIMFIVMFYFVFTGYKFLNNILIYGTGYLK